MPEFSSTNQPETRGAGGQKNHKIIRDALMLALHREVEHEGVKTKRINQIAEALCRKAGETGDAVSAREVFDRFAGKAAQPIVGDDEADPVNVKVTTIKRVIVERAGDTNSPGVPPAPGAGAV